MYEQQMEMRQGGCGCSSMDYASMLTKWAKAELLKEKVKVRLEKHYGAKLDKAADLIVEVVTTKAKSIQELEGKQDELDELVGQVYQDEEENNTPPPFILFQ